MRDAFACDAVPCFHKFIAKSSEYRVYDLLGVNSEAYSPLSLTIPLRLVDSTSSYIESSILRVSSSPNDPVAADSLSSSTMFSGALHKLCEQIRMYDLDGGY